MKNLDVVALDSLAALADHGSFDRAAQSLSITQSAVSQRLRALEAQVGQRLVVRSRPLQLTPAGAVLLRFARQLQALRADVARELGAGDLQDALVPIAVNADSLATWVPQALDAVVQAGHREGYGLELVVDDQDHTHEWMRQGAVLGCVSTVREALRGCRVVPLGVARYVAVASAEFLARHLPDGLNRANFASVPFVVFNRKDELQVQWVALAFGVQEPKLRQRFVPDSVAYVRALELGWGVGLVPERMLDAHGPGGPLAVLHPGIRLPVALYWHQWQLGAADAPLSPRGALLDQIGAALQAGARDTLDPVASTS